MKLISGTESPLTLDPDCEEFSRHYILKESEEMIFAPEVGAGYELHRVMVRNEGGVATVIVSFSKPR